MSSKTKYAYLKGWVRNSLEEIQHQLEDELVISGKVKLTQEQANELVAFLQDASNFDTYGAELDFALFYELQADNPNKPCVSGSITPVYKKDTANKPVRSRRSV